MVGVACSILRIKMISVFARYPFPGKGATDYWNDADVFGHFIQTVVKPSDRTTNEPLPGPANYENPPKSNKLWYFLSPLMPYVLIAALINLAVYLLYKGVGEFINSKEHPLTVLGNVAGMAGLLTSLTVAVRLPRLTLLWRWWLAGWLLFFAGAGLYSYLASSTAREKLGSWVGRVGFHGKERARGSFGCQYPGLDRITLGAWIMVCRRGTSLPEG